MPVLVNPVNTRLEILKTVYRLSGKESDKMIKLDAAQINGGYYGEILYQLRFLKERGFVNFTNNFISRKFQVSLTTDGLQLISDIYHAVSMQNPQKDELLDLYFSKIRT